MANLSEESTKDQDVSERGQAENSSTPAGQRSDRLRQLAIACLLEAGRRTFAVTSIEAGKKKQRYFDPLFRTVVIGHLGFGAPAAKFKSVSELARMCRISRNTAARGIDELIRLNVFFEVGKTRRPLLLCVNVNVEAWLVTKIIGDEAWLTMLAEWRIFCCSTQLELPLPDFGLADPTLQQLLALVNLDNAVQKTRPTVEQEKRPTVERQPHCGASETLHSGALQELHINVGTKRSFNRSTMNGKNARWKEYLQRVREFLGKSGDAYLEDEMARLIPMWTILAQKEGELLERAVADLEDKERTGFPSDDRAKRLTSLVKGWIGNDRWSELFPGAS